MRSGTTLGAITTVRHGPMRRLAQGSLGDRDSGLQDSGLR